MCAHSSDRYTQTFEFELIDELTKQLLPDYPLIRAWRIEIVTDDGVTDGFDVISADDLAKAFHCGGTREVVRKLEGMASATTIDRDELISIASDMDNHALTCDHYEKSVKPISLMNYAAQIREAIGEDAS